MIQRLKNSIEKMNFIMKKKNKLVELLISIGATISEKTNTNIEKNLESILKELENCHRKEKKEYKKTKKINKKKEINKEENKELRKIKEKIEQIKEYLNFKEINIEDSKKAKISMV